MQNETLYCSKRAAIELDTLKCPWHFRVYTTLARKLIQEMQIS